MARIFISHSSLDGEQATRLLAWLHTQGFVSTFLDFDKHHGLAPGSDWERTLYRELSGADAVILILTKNWFSSKWCFVEFAQARALGKAIFPLIETPTGDTIVSSDIQHLNLTLDRAGGLERLQSELTRIALNTRGGFPWDQTRPPYPGLLAFDEADAAIYFGRDDDIRRLIERLNSRRAQGGEKLVVVLGASGSGKSSLLRAGVVPRLKRDPHNWIVLPPFRPQLHPLDELAQAIASALGPGTDPEQWSNDLASTDPTQILGKLARKLRALHGHNEAQILLIIDQGEELFANANPEQSAQFFRVLNALLSERLPFLVAMSLRSDYLGRLQQEPLITAPFEQFSLKPMPLERIRDIIEGPAKVAGILVDEPLISAAIADARTEDALPLLAFAMRELYDSAANSGRLTVEAYRALGDQQAQLSPLENAVRRKADEVLSAARPTPEDLQSLKEAFIPAMVRVNPEGEYVRRPAAISALPSRAIALLERLAKARLLTILDERGVSTVEVTHEALLRKWPLLRGWLDEEREFLIGKDQLEQDVLDYQRASPDQKTEALLTGLKLTRARQWLLAKPHQLTPAERTFIQTSITHQEEEAAIRERTRRRILYASAAASAILAIAALSAGWEWHQEKVQEQLARSRQYAAQSIEDLNDNLANALPDAVTAASYGHTVEAEAALNQALQAPHAQLRLHHNDAINTCGFSHDGSRIVTASDDHTARIWDATTGRPIATLLDDGHRVYSATFSADDKRIVTQSFDGPTKEWDAATGRLLSTLPQDEPTEKIASPEREAALAYAKRLEPRAGEILAISPDGTQILTNHLYRELTLWDVKTGQELHSLPGSPYLKVHEYSHNGKMILTVDLSNNAELWDTSTGTRAQFLIGHTAEITTAQFSADDQRILTVSWDGSAKVWDSDSGRMLASIPALVSLITNGIGAAAISPDGNRVLTLGGSDEAILWTLSDEHVTARIETDWLARFKEDPLSHAIYLPTARGDRVAVWMYEFDSIDIWEVSPSHLIASLTSDGNGFEDTAFSPDGRLLVTADKDGELNTWDGASGKALRKFDVPWPSFLANTEERHRSVSFSHDGSSIEITDEPASNSSDSKNEPVTRLLNVVSGIWTTQQKTEGGLSSPDDRRFAIEGAVYDAANGRKLFEIGKPEDGASISQFSKDGTQVVGQVGRVAAVWDATTGREIAHSVAEHGDIKSLEISPDGKFVVTVAAQGRGTNVNGVVRVWDARTGKTISTLPVVLGNTFLDSRPSAQFMRDGRTVFLALGDSLVSGGIPPQLSDASSGKVLLKLSGRSDPTVLLDGKHVFVTGSHGEGELYLLDYDELLARAKKLLPINSGE